MNRLLFFVLWTVLSFGGGIGSAHAQIEDELHTGTDTCTYFGETLPNKLTTFSPDEETENLIKAIVRASGLIPNFVVRAGGVLNAAAVMRSEKRFIIYNQNFVRNLTQKTGNRWATISVMAHEIGHHLNGHTLQTNGSRHRLELEADYYSGFILQKMGASLEDTRKAIELFANPVATPTHPARHDRLAAVTNGWVASCNADTNCRRVVASAAEAAPMTTSYPGGSRLAPADVIRIEARPEMRALLRTDPRGDSCEFANNGACDEPSLCRPGTDSTDCRYNNLGPVAAALAPPPALPPAAWPSGQSMQACGCWGINPHATAAEPRCLSGQVRLSVCPGRCPASKSQPYAYVCQ